MRKDMDTWPYPAWWTTLVFAPLCTLCFLDFWHSLTVVCRLLQPRVAQASLVSCR